MSLEQKDSGEPEIFIKVAGLGSSRGRRHQERIRVLLTEHPPQLCLGWPADLISQNLLSFMLMTHD
jgi:hypothetical protein